MQNAWHLYVSIVGLVAAHVTIVKLLLDLLSHKR
jgi:hypothetical protein